MSNTRQWTLSKSWNPQAGEVGAYQYWTQLFGQKFGPFADKGAALLDMMERLNDVQHQIADAAFDILREVK